jgi:hypothetical protein
VGKRGPKSDPIRDLKIYNFVSQTKFPNLFEAQEAWEEAGGFHIGPRQFLRCYRNGEKLFKQGLPPDQPLKKGEGLQSDAVRDASIYYSVCDLIEKGCSQRKAYRLVLEDLDGQYPSINSDGAIKAIYKKMSQILPL